MMEAATSKESRRFDPPREQTLRLEYTQGLESVAAADEPSAESVTEAAQPSHEAVPESASSDSAKRELLSRRGKTRIYGLVTDEPWTLAVDGLVIPVGPDPQLRGGLAQAFLGYLDGLLLRDQFMQQFASIAATERQKRDTGVEGPLVHPESPLLVPLSAEFYQQGVPPFIVGATAFGGSSVTSATPTAANAAVAAQSVIQLAATHGLRRIAFPLLGTGDGGLSSPEVAEAMFRAIVDALPEPNVDEITVATREADALVAIRNLLRQRSQPIRNDVARGDDLLRVEGEVSALAEALLLRDLEPPLAVGILGGWGTGKSFVLHLMQQRMIEIRSLGVVPDHAWPADTTPGEASAFPYVGHVYLINFDAWTYAKSNLWASLMQTVFFELSRQLTLERQLESVGVLPGEGGEVWRALYAMEDGKRDAILESELSRDLFAKFQVVARGSGEDADDFLWRTLRDLKAEERKDLHRSEEKLLERREELEKARETLAKAIDDEIKEESHKAAWAPVQKQLQTWLGNKLDLPVDHPAELPTLRLGPGTLLSLIEHNWLEYSAFLVFFLACVIAPLIASRLESYQFPGLVLGLSSVVAANLRVMDRWRRMLAETYADYQRQVADERARLEAERPLRIKQRLAAQEAEMSRLLKNDAADLTKLKDNVPTLERDVAQLEAQVERHRQRVGLTAKYVSLADFVSTRLDEAFYEKQLGMMHQVQRDLVELTEGLVVLPNDPQETNKRAAFPRGPARVVIFIDDLDRCPPDKVVEVLEATQLLVKTPLFVVVLALDERFVTRALEKAYAGVLAPIGGPSGQDYLEKIIQIPYRLRRIETDAVRWYLRAQMDVQPASETTKVSSASAPTSDQGDSSLGIPSTATSRVQDPLGVLPEQVLKFSEEEFSWLHLCAIHIELSPRSLKRLVNQYKLLKIVWYRPTGRTQPSLDGQRLAVLLLALAARSPSLMRRVFDALSEDFRQRNEPRVGAGHALDASLQRGREDTFASFLNDFKVPESDLDLQRELQYLVGRVSAVSSDRLTVRLSAKLTLIQLDPDTLDLIRSFSP